MSYELRDSSWLSPIGPVAYCKSGDFAELGLTGLGKIIVAASDKIRLRSEDASQSNDPVFGETMRYATLFGRASTLAAMVYRALPPGKKEPGLYKKLTGQAMRMLKEGKTEREVLDMLQPVKIEKNFVAVVAKKQSTVEEILFADEVLLGVFEEAEDEVIFEEAPP